MNGVFFNRAENIYQTIREWHCSWYSLHNINSLKWNAEQTYSPSSNTPFDQNQLNHFARTYLVFIILADFLNNQNNWLEFPFTLNKYKIGSSILSILNYHFFFYGIRLFPSLLSSPRTAWKLTQSSLPRLNSSKMTLNSCFLPMTEE